MNIITQIKDKIFGVGKWATVPKYIMLGLLVGAIIFGITMMTKEARKPSIKTAATHILTKAELAITLKAANVGSLTNFIKSEQFGLVSEKWIRNDASFGFGVYLYDNNRLKYNELTNNCVDFSDAFIAYCKEKYAKDTGSTNPPAIGKMYFFPGIDAHSINIIAGLDTDKKVKFMLYEPQNQGFVEINEGTLGSAYSYFFP